MNSRNFLAAAEFANSVAHATLDDLFVRVALRRPGDFALIDPPNRRTFADGAARYVTYAAADRMVSAIAGRLHQLGLARRTVIGLQFPNMAEGVLTLLGVLRAGMIAAPLPLLWRRAEIVSALGQIGAKAIISGGRVGSDDLCESALHVGAELFSIRYVCGFGAEITDGAIPFGELFTADRLDPVPRIARGDYPETDIAVVTWDTTMQGYVAAARNHAQLIAGGIAIMLEGQIEPDANILAALNFASFSGLALTVMPWLLSGGTLALHHGFDPKVFAESCAAQRCETVVLPGPITAEINDAGYLAHEGLRNVVAVWRTPERLATSPAWRHANANLMDVQVFGEVGLVGTRREASGMPAALSIGPVMAPRTASGIAIAEVARTEADTLALRGPMVPRDPFPLAVAQGEAPTFKADKSGYVDTGYPCRVDRLSGTVALTGPPAGIINVGGYRFAQRELQDLVGRTGKQASFAALPDPYLSHRLVGSAADRAAVRNALIANGTNALVAGAFRGRRKPRAA